MLKNKPMNMNSVRSINLIVDALLSLLKDKSFSDVSISELVKNAGLVRNTFYAHFESKEDILIYYMYEMFRERIQLELKDKTLEDLNLELMYFEIWADQIDFLEILKKNRLMHLLNQFGSQFNLICEEFNIVNQCNVSDQSKAYADPLYADALASIVNRWIELGEKETPVELSGIFKEFIQM